MLAALIGLSTSVTVVRMCPASISFATWFSRRCCSIMSGVWCMARANMNSQCRLAAFIFMPAIGIGWLVSSMLTMPPCGRISSTAASQWRMSLKTAM